VDCILETSGFSEIAQRLATVGREFHRRGWVLGTSGNFSEVLSHDPLRLAITASGVDKGALAASHILQVDESALVISGEGRPSAETKLHLAVVQLRQANAVLHTHSVWSTMLSDEYGDAGGFNISGYEMLKGLEGVDSHEHIERVPIIENSQDADLLARRIHDCLGGDPRAHCFLLRRHGLYTWGRNLDEAKRHIEIMEFLLEIVGRTRQNARC
jgi:methylthioribulose-1-phosphate dehydratase